MLAFDKTFIDRDAPVKGSGKACSVYEKFTYYYSLKNKLKFDFAFFNNFTQLSRDEFTNPKILLLTIFILQARYTTTPVFHVET